MGNQTPDLPPDQVIVWLRTPAGEAWSRARIGWNGRLNSHLGQVLFVEVIPDNYGKYAKTRWPRPYKKYDLGDG